MRVLSEKLRQFDKVPADEPADVQALARFDGSVQMGLIASIRLLPHPGHPRRFSERLPEELPRRLAGMVAKPD